MGCRLSFLRQIILLWAAIASGAANAGDNLLLNGDFASGDFTNWTLGADTSYVNVVGSYPLNSAMLGPVTTGTLSQAFTTSPSASLRVSFSLENTKAGTNAFLASLNGSPLLTLTNAGALGAEVYSYQLKGAAGGANSLDFSYQNSAGFWLLSDISVLMLGPSLEETQTSLAISSAALQRVYQLQSTLINIGLTYDCARFDQHGVCLSVGERFAGAEGSSGNTAGLLVGAFRVSDHLRVGAYLDQRMLSERGQGIDFVHSSPFFGAFGVWREDAERPGLEVRLAAGYGSQDLTLTRGVVGSSEPGVGSSNLTAEGLAATVAYNGLWSWGSWLATPYVGLRHTRLVRAGYSEVAGVNVQAPLSYQGLTDRVTTALLGLQIGGQLTDLLGLQFGLGLEGDIERSTDRYRVTGLDGLNPIDFGGEQQRVRPFASMAASFKVHRAQYVGVSAIYRDDPQQSKLTGFLTYQIAF